MKLRSVHKQEFKSARDSNLINIGDVLRLAGQNEAAKSSLLESLHGLAPVSAAEAKVENAEDCLLSQVEQEDEKPSESAVISAIFIFTIQLDEMQPVTDDFGGKIFNTPTVTVLRDYSGQQSIMLDLNERAAVERLVEQAGLPAALAAEARAQATLKQLLNFLALKAEVSETARKLSESEAPKQLRSKVEEIEKEGLATLIWRQYLSAKLPPSLYFEDAK